MIPSNLPPSLPPTPALGQPVDAHALQADSTQPESEMQSTFREFVGKTLFGQMLASMHKTHDKASYFHGGRAEEIFQQQLDQVMVEEITESSAAQIADPMYELFNMSRPN